MPTFYISQQLTADGASGSPQARQLQTMSAVNSDLYMFGGLAEGTDLNSLWLFDLITADWSNITPTASPSARDSHTMCAIGSNLYLFGGKNGTITITSLDYDPLFQGFITTPANPPLGDFWQFDTISDVWTLLTPTTTPPARCLHGMVANNSTLYLFGGYSASLTNLSDFWMYDTSQSSPAWQRIPQSATQPSARCSFGMGIINNNLFIFSGSNDGIFLSDCWQWRMSDNSWSQLGNTPFALENMSVCTINSDLYVFGGLDSNQLIRSDLWKFDGLNWTHIMPYNNPLPARVQHSATAVGTNLYIFGGVGNTSNHNDLWQLSFQDVSLNISDLQTPLSVYADASFDVSFLLNEQNGSGAAQTVLNWNGSDYSPTSTSVVKVFWIDSTASALPGIYSADFDPASSNAFSNISFTPVNSIPINSSISYPSPVSNPITGLSVNLLDNIIYISCGNELTGSDQVFFSGLINFNQITSITAQPIDQNLAELSFPTNIFWDPVSHQIYWIDQSNSTIYSGLATNMGNGQTNITNINNFRILNGINSIFAQGLFIDSVHDVSYVSIYTGFSAAQIYANSTQLLTTATINQPTGIFLNVTDSTIYWININVSDVAEFWKGTIDNLSNPKAILTPVLISQSGFGGAQNPSGLCMFFYPPHHTVSLQAPSIGSDYTLTVTAHDANHPNFLGVKATTVHVMQLVLSDGLNRNTIATGDPYTISWSAEVINQQPSTSPVVVNVLRPEGLSSNHYGIGEVQDMAPLIPSDYAVTITACTSDICISDTLLLHVKNLVINAGSDQIITYGQSAQLGSTANDPTVTYTWSPSDTLNNPNSDAPVATSLTTTVYTVVGYQPMINRYASDSVTIAVVAPITLSDVTITPSLTCASGGPVQIAWNVTPLNPSPNYHLTITRFDGSVILSAYYSNTFSGTVSDLTPPSVPGDYPYYLTIVRNDYGQLSDSAVKYLTVVQPHIAASALPPITPTSDPYIIQWTASLSNGKPSDVLAVTVHAPGGTVFTSDCLNGVSYQNTFNAPALASDFLVTVNAVYSKLSDCSDTTTFVLKTKRVAVDAGSDRTVMYNTPILLGVGLDDADIVYTWSPSTWLSTTTGLHSTATPLSDITYTVVAFRSDVQKSASDSVTLTPVAPIYLSNVQITPKVTPPGTPITISFNVSSDGPALNYQAIIQRSDGSSLPFANYTTSSVTVSDIAPLTPGRYPYTITVMRNNFGGFSDQKIVYLDVTQVKLLNVQAITNPTPIGDPYLIQWEVFVENPQPNESITVTVQEPEDASPVTRSFFAADYRHGETGFIQATAPETVSDYLITVTATDHFGGLYSDTITLKTAFVTVDAGSDQTINYGASVMLGAGLQESDIVYTWTHSDTLSAPNTLKPTATPKTTTTYRVEASREFGLGVEKHANDTVTITVIAPIALSDVTVTPNLTCASAGGTVQIGWQLASSDPAPNYHMLITRSDGTVVLSSDYSNSVSGFAVDTAPTACGIYPYYLSVTRNDYGQLSDTAVVNLSVVQAEISAGATPFISTADPYNIHWTASVLGGGASDTLSVTILAPDSPPFITESVHGQTYNQTFNAPNTVSDFTVTVTAVYDALPSCTSATFFTVGTRKVAVDAGSDQTINYGASAQLGRGLADPDIVYTWSPTDSLSASTGLHPLAAPLSDTTYQVIAFRSDVNSYAVDTVTITVVAPISLLDVNISPTPTAPGTPLNISWNLVGSIPAPTLQYQAIIQRSDGSVVSSDNYTALSGMVSDTAPLVPGTYPYTIIIIRDDFGGLSDQHIAYLNVTQVFLSDVQAITNPTSIGDPYLIQWSVYAQNPQPNEIVKVHVIMPSDQFVITPEQFTALYNLNETGQTTFLSPFYASDYTITVTAFDGFGSSDSQTIILQARDVSVDAGPDRTMRYGSDTVLGVGLQESDIVYTWSPSSWLNTTTGLHPTATPLSDVTYTVIAFRSDIGKTKSDTVTISITASIALSDVRITPALVSGAQPIQIVWQIVTPDLTPNYHLTITRFDGEVLLSSDYTGVLSGTVSDVSPSTFGLFPYYLSAVRNDYGQLSDSTAINVAVVQAHIEANAFPNPTSNSDPYYIQWTASLLGGFASDTLTVTIDAPDSALFVSDAVNYVPYEARFWAPDISSDYLITVTATYDRLPACSDVKTFTLVTKRVVVDAGSDQIIDYGSSATLGAGLADSDVVYTWSPSYALSTTTGLFPEATPLSDTIYTVLAFRSDLQRSASDSVTIKVVAPIQLDVEWSS